MLILTSIWPSTVEGWVGLITLIVGLVGAIAALVPTLIKLFKAGKKLIKEKNWKKIMEIADAAMKEAEKVGEKGTKKEMVIAAVKKGCEEAGIELEEELLQDLYGYIEECIEWFNGMNKATKGNNKNK